MYYTRTYKQCEQQLSYLLRNPKGASPLGVPYVEVRWETDEVEGSTEAHYGA